ncbi:TadA family conjugal transfer-associated ATPase [Schaalia odontolytica]|uniref:TadA family conjugal transfer-associated ATPase n=1 Tax=Schaalia odontolytica TaxID=1660 RepID=UPI0028D0A144|nr:TadA family conjugal transfer-associated ATPase [Schaalia odontolytica]
MPSALRLLARGALPARAASDTSRPGCGAREVSVSLEMMRARQRGMDPTLADLLDDPGVTDVLINGAQAWVDRGGGLVRVDAGIRDEAAARHAAIRLASACGARLDDASPVADGTLPGGVRLHAVLPPVSGSGTLISLRVLGTKRLSVADLVARGTLPGAIGPLLRTLVVSRANVLVSGATGSGKTTLLSAALSLVPSRERIVCIEEVSEVAPAHPHCVHLVERKPNVEGRGAVTLSDLVRAAMRMRPDRLVLGECRGIEVRDVLTALNTGHDGGWATIHANGAREVPARLAALGSLAGMGEGAVAAQAASALDAVLHMRRDADGHRWVSEVGVLTIGGGSLECLPALRATFDGRVTTHEAWDLLAGKVGL